MAVNLSPVGGVAAQFFTNAGVPLSGGKIYTYAAGTSTPQATYTTGAGNIQHSNPIVLDAAGRVPTGEIWLTDGLSYKFVLKDANDVLIATYDNIVGINSNFVNFVNQQEIQTATAGQTVFNLTTMEYQPGTNSLSVFVDGVNQYGPGAQYAYTETDSNTVTFVSGLHVGAEVKFTSSQIQNAGAADASQITYDPPFTDSVATNVEAKLAQYVSVKDFGAVGDGVTDDTTALQNADDAAALSGQTLLVNSGDYVITSDIAFESALQFEQGSKLISAGTNYVIFNGGITAPLDYCLDIAGFVKFLKTEQIYPQWFGAMGDATYGAGTISSGSTSFTQTIYQPGASQTTLQNGDTIYIYGAGSGGGILSTTVVSGGGTSSLTLANAASTSVTNAAFATRNNTIALQRFFASTISAGPTTPAYGTSLPSTTGSSKLYIPKGIYTSFDTIDCYSCNVVEGDYGYIPSGSSKLIQCNISKPLIKLIADNFDENGNSTNGGNGNNVFRYVSFASATIDDTQLNAPVVYFEFPWNVHSDSEFDHCYWTGTAGACVGGGFQTTGTINSGSTSLTLADGSVFRNGNFGGGKIIVKGAGVAGADLSTYIVSGGGTNTVTIANAASTSVTNAVVYPYSQVYDPIKFTTCEMDVCRAGIEFGANAQGQIWVNDLEAFQVVRGAIRITAVGNTFSIVVSNSHFDGCGASFNSESTYRNSIYVDNGSPTNGGLFVKNSYFSQLVDIGITTGGPIWFRGASITLTDNNFYNLDTSDLVKFVYTSAANYKIKDNTFTSNSLTSYTNSRIIGFSNATLPTSWNVSGNVFINTNASAINTAIQSDYPIEGGISIDNLFRGLFTTAYDINIYNLNNTLFPNYGFGPTVKSGSAIPTGGTYAVGSIVWNDLITNAAGQPVGWVCVVGGTPGTWRSFGVTV